MTPTIKGWVLVTKVTDPSMWYSARVGVSFPVIQDLPSEGQWLVRDRASGYSNVIKYTDGVFSEQRPAGSDGEAGPKPMPDRRSSVEDQTSQDVEQYMRGIVSRRISVDTPISGILPGQHPSVYPPFKVPPVQFTPGSAIEDSKKFPSHRVGQEVIGERLRQVLSEGWTAAHDDRYLDSELLQAAAAYAFSGHTDSGGVPATWPWNKAWWKPSSKRRNLIKAAALILAEIERIDREEQKELEDKNKKDIKQ